MTIRPLLPSLFLLLALPAAAADLTVELEIPRLNVAEYHRPYLAVWLERADGAPAGLTHLAVLYDAKKKNDEGSKWLKDLRQWWRRGGRELAMPVDGLVGATPTVGKHVLRFSAGNAPLGKLAAGDYKLQVEAAREVGGRELLSIPFSWPPKQAQQLPQQGQSELGRVVLNLIP